MAKERSKVKMVKKLNDSIKKHSQNPKMVARLQGRLATVEKSK
jgi:hypothetical protein